MCLCAFVELNILFLCVCAEEESNDTGSRIQKD